MKRFRYYFDWLFKDLHGRNGKYIIAEAPNAPLVIFMVFIILSVILYPGFFQKTSAIIAYVSLVIWGILEVRSGRSRFRRLLGILGILSAAGAVALGLGM